MKNRTFEVTVVGRLFLPDFRGDPFPGHFVLRTEQHDLWPTNVYVFTPSNSISSINSTLATLAGQLAVQYQSLLRWFFDAWHLYRRRI